jgi:hypothetical protein
MNDHPYKGNIATLPDAEHISNARNYCLEKELVNRLQVVAKVGDEYETPIDARFWMGRSRSASVVYCSIWVHGRINDRKDWSGRGTAGGGNFPSESAALEDAIRSAGIVMGSRFGGCGEGAMRHALTAIAVALGYEDFTIV